MTSKISVLIPALLVIAAWQDIGLCQPPANPRVSAHGGKILGNGSRSAEVNIDSRGRSVRVYLQPEGTKNPPAVELTLIDKNNKVTTLELKAISPGDSSVPIYSGILPAVSPVTGSLSPYSSFVGIELRIPLTRDKTEVLRLDSAQ